MTTTPEAYVHLSTDETTLTFYYDTLRAERDGTTWGIGEKKIEEKVEFCAWAGTYYHLNRTITIVVFDASFGDFFPTTTDCWFYSLKSLKSIEGFEYLNTSQVTKMWGMFEGCESLTSLDLSSFDTSKVTDMGSMFSGCKSLTTLDFSSFDTSMVRFMGIMFHKCSSLTALDLSNFDTSKVKKMDSMFSWCSALTALDLSRFDTSKVTDMSGMFSWCSALTTIYCNSSWSYDNSGDMFYGCDSLKGVVTYVKERNDVSMANPERGYFTKKVLAQEDEAYVHLSADKKTLTFYFDRERNFRMRCYAWGIEETILQNDKRTPAWLSSKVASKEKITKIVIDESFRNVVPKTTAGWFEGLTALEEIRGLDNLNTSEVTDMSRMFAGCGALRSLDVSRFDTLNVKQMQQMFMGCAALTEIDLYFFDTAKVTDMHEMFKDCKGLTTLDLQSFNTSQVTDMGEMFRDCESLTTLALSSFYTSRVTNMGYMFAGCKSLRTLNLAHFFTENVTTMWRMFEGCSALESLVLSCFNTAQVTDLHAMFKDCKRLTTLDLSNFQTSEVKDMREMFSGCVALTTIWSFAFRNCFASEAMFYECTSLQGATNFNEKYTDARMANPERGYFSRR